MNITNVARRASLLLLISLCALPFFAHAQTPTANTSRPTVVATVNIYDAKIVSQQGNAFSISFDLSNREGAQPGVRYAVQLLDQNQTVVDEHLYPDTVNLNSNTTIPETINYTTPAYLSGVYQLTLLSRNTGGLVLAHASLGDVTLSGTGPYVEILPSTCYLTVASEKSGAQYTLSQGVDIAASETLNLTCTVENHSQSALTLMPSFETFYRNTFGSKVADNDSPQAPVSVSAGKQTTFTVPVPKALAPQAYDAKLTFSSVGNVPSNSVVVHYVLRGVSATIQNLILDKTAYEAGETAQVSLYWTGSADSFLGARFAPSSMTGMRASFHVVDASGNSCGSDVTASLDATHPKQTIAFPVSNTCVSPKVTAALSDSSGTVLASSSYNFVSSVPPNAPSPASQGFTQFLLFLAVLIALGVLGAIALRMRESGTSTPPPALLLILAISALALSAAPQQVRADTFTEDVYLVSSGGWNLSDSVQYDVNINKSTYAPGETITAAGNVTSAACGNSLEGAVTASINGQNRDVFRSHLVVEGPHTYHVQIDSSSNTFTAQNTPGSYVAQFYPELHVPNEGPGSGSRFSVNGGGMVRNWIGQDPYEIPYTISGTCTPAARTCQTSGNLQDNCGGITTCQYGCSASTNQCNTTCVPGQKTCRADGNLTDACGNATTCQYGCSTATNQCRTQATCVPRNICNTASTKVVNQCDNVLVEDCQAENMYCSAGQCLPLPLGFLTFDAFDGSGNAFTATGQLQAVPSLVPRDGTSRLYWNIDHAKSCTITGTNGDTWDAPFSGSLGETTGALAVQTTYTLHCIALDGALPPTIDDSVTVNILPVFMER